MYVQVVVLSYQSPEIDFYTYEVPKSLEGQIKIGQLVSVPFGKRTPIGLILDTSYQIPDTKISIKPITSILLEKPFLVPYQIKLLKWMSVYYFAPMLNCLESMLPEIPKRLEKFQLSTFNFQFSTQTLVLVPTINHLPQTLAQFPQAKNHAVYTNELKTSERFAVWQKILSSSCDFIFGSRSAIFSPCPNLKKIIIFDEHDSAYKDSRSPYFDTLTVAEKISKLTGAELEIIDSSPKVSTFFNHSKVIKIPKYAAQTKIVSLENDKKLGNYSPISLTLEEIIKRAYSKKLSILLFLNKKIESGSIYCKNCKHQEFLKSQPDLCPNCKSPEIFFNSTNTNSLAKEIQKILPGSSTNIIAEDSKFSTFNSPFDFSQGKQLSTITIATSSVFYKLITKKFDLVAHLYADSPLNFNEYNSTEEIYSQIANLKKLTRKLLVIQTYNDLLPAIKFASSGNYEAFYKSELAPRKLLNYPPYSLLVKISITGKKEIEIEKKSQQIYKDVSTKLPATSYQLPVTILGPYKVLHQKALSYNITLKIRLNNYSLESRDKELNKIRILLPRQKDVRIIVEPKNLNQ